MLSVATADLLADEIWSARATGHLTRLTDVAIGALSLDSAYDVQDRLAARQLAGPDEVAGWKAGCTSAAVRRQFGLDQPVAARIYRSQLHRSGVRLPAASFVDCAVEAELVLRIADGRPEAAGIGIELHHYRFFHGQPTSQELVAGNALQAGLVVSDLMPIVELGPPDAVRTDLLVNGEVVATGLAAEIMDAGPLTSLAWLQEHLRRRGHTLRDGDLVLPGSAVPLIPVRSGDVVEARGTGLGACRLTLD